MIISITENTTQSFDRTVVAIEGAAPFTGTERQIEAATGIRQRIICQAAEHAWGVCRAAQPIEAGFAKMAARLDAVTAKQWLDANDEWDGSPKGAGDIIARLVHAA